MLAAGEKQSFCENLQESGSGAHAPKLAYAFVVYAGYCIAAKLDGALAVQPGNIPAFSLADAFLVAALLGPPRTWWIVLAGALPACLIEEMANHGSVPMALAVFTGNFTAALAAVALLRRLSFWPPRFQTARDIIVFMLVGCGLPSLIGASLQVMIHSGEAHGISAGQWSRLLFSRMASLAIVIPAAAMAVNRIKGGQKITWRRFVEGAALCLAILISSWVVFGFSMPMGAGWALGGIALSCLIWAAARFGAGGTSAGLLVTGLCAAGFASHGRGLFRYADPADSAIGLEVLMVTVSAPLLVLAALLRTRERESSREARWDDPGSETTVSLVGEGEKKSIGNPLCEDFRMRLAEQAEALGYLEKRLKRLRDGGISEPPILDDLKRLQQAVAALEKEFELVTPELSSTSTEIPRQGFERVLRAFCREFGASRNLRVELSFETMAHRISTPVAGCCFGVVQAGLSHAAREARATEAQIKIAAGADRLFLMLAENGTESPPAAAMENWSEAKRMKRYVESLSGEFRIARRETRGTLLVAVLPI